MTVSAQIVADSVSPTGKRLTSFQITAHRFILAEINTHRMLSRSYHSSRAVPSKRLIEEVKNDPAMPIYWGANQKGMQAAVELNDAEPFETGWIISDKERAKRKWREAAYYAARAAEEMSAIGLHKQIANRVLEPFLWVHGIVTATEWDNFFGLRLHEDAQPEFRALADAMWKAMKASTPEHLEPGGWHLPYFKFGMNDDRTGQSEDYIAVRAYALGKKIDAQDLAIKVSVARCARSSYNSFDTGKRSTIEEDLAIYAKLNIPGAEHYDPARPIHASPAEHQGTPDQKSYDIDVNYRTWEHPEEHGNLSGWRQYRKMLHGEAVAPMPKGYKK